MLGEGQLPAELSQLIEKEGNADKKYHPHYTGRDNAWDSFPDPGVNSRSRPPQVVFEAIADKRSEELAEQNLIDASRILFHETPPLWCCGHSQGIHARFCIYFLISDVSRSSGLGGV